MAFDIRLLAGVCVLASVVESGSFTRAGEILGVDLSLRSDPGQFFH
ncbi:hypothetical protein ABIF70_005153 [Bradyrhizobium japonicum]